jgi:hypothetical protein
LTDGSARRAVFQWLVGARRMGPVMADDPADARSAFLRDAEIVMMCRSGLCPDATMGGVGVFRRD